MIPDDVMLLGFIIGLGRTPKYDDKWTDYSGN